MRATTSSLITALCVLTLLGCTSTGPTAPDPSATAGTGDAALTASPAQTPAADVPAEVMLPAAAWADITPDDVREDSAGVVGWRVPESCDAGNPADGAMRTVTQGSGELESRVGVHQVAVLADADAAVTEADRLAAALTACTQRVSDDATVYVVEPLAVGAQGVGLATDYYGDTVEGALDDAMGTYLTVTRRGNAITLVAVEGGEGTVGTARETATTNAQAAWELLCTYDSAGC
ncbi:hypothetical protein [Cellulomonas terrae]|nr:hypothetical protein [Cellulomonas terrae]